MTTDTRTETGYNGYTNYETWAVKLWMDNEEPTYDYWRERTIALWEAASPGGLIASFTREDNARMDLADDLSAPHSKAYA